MFDLTLSAYNQFLADVRSLPVCSDEQLRDLAVCAAADPAARHPFVEAFLPKIVRIARSRVSLCRHLDLLDVVQMGIEVLFERLHRAFEHPDPVAYLCKTIDKQLLWMCLRFDSLVVVPTHAPVHSVVSIDVPVTNESMTTFADLLPAPAASAPVPGRDYTALYQALEQLSEDQRFLIVCRYGLFCQAPTSQGDLAREWFPHVPLEDARSKIDRMEQSALLALKRILADEYRKQQFYTSAEIEQLYGAESTQLRRFVAQGRLTRYPAPDGCYGANNKLAYVYDRQEVDALLKDWKPRGYVRRQRLQEVA